MKYTKDQIEFLKEHNLSGFREYKKDPVQEDLQRHIEEYHESKKQNKFKILESKINYEKLT